MILISVEVPTQLQWYVIKGDKFFLKFTLLEILFFSFFLHYDFLVLFRIFLVWYYLSSLCSCQKSQGMLTPGPASDPKCELNIRSFLQLPHPLHCPICAKDIMITVLLLQVMGGWEGWGVVHLW